MYQLATQGGGFGPTGFGMPPADANNKKTYVYDIDHRNDLCTAVVKVMDLSAIPVSIGVVCPVGTGAAITTDEGGVIAGYDMYGQHITETVGLAGTSDACFMSVISAPADAVWTNTYGLPYKHLSNDGLPADVTYIAATGTNGRGAFTYAGSDAEVALSYTVDRVNMFGDVRADFATTDAIDAVTFAAALTQATGVIAITTALVADDSETVTYVFPDGHTVEADNGVGTVSHTLSPLYMSQYGRLAMGDQNLDGLVRAVTKNGTHVIVNITGTVAPTAASDDPADPAPAPDPAPELPASFSTHAQANAWLDAYTSSLGIGEPLDWANQSLAEKHAAATALVAAHT